MTKIQDVARAAGVSVATVSRVLNGNDRVDAILRDRVLAAVEELEYRPNILARALRTRVTTTIGLVVPDIENPFFTALARGVEDTTARAGFSVMLCNSDEQVAKEERYLQALTAQHAAGIIVAPASERDSDLEVAIERDVPVVAVDRRLTRQRVDTVLVNNVHGASMAAHHLLGAGVQRPAMISGPQRTSTGADRRKGFLSVFSAAGQPVGDRQIVEGGFRVHGGYQSLHELWSADPPPDGLFIANNLMAVGALSALAELGVRVPDQVACVCFDDIPWGHQDHGIIPVVRQPAHAMGEAAADLLLARIRGRGGPAHEVMLDPTLITDPGAHPPWLGRDLAIPGSRARGGQAADREGT